MPYHFKNIILSDKYLDEESKLTAVIGVDDNNEPILFNFAKHPHLFIGGDQGCGKSTLIHSIIMSLMQRNTPDKFQFVLFDAKGLEISLYEKSKYLYTKSRNIGAILEYILHECDVRLKVIADSKKRSLASYNEFAELSDDISPMPELFVFLDEISYFISDDLKNMIERLIIIGRTFGVHLIVSDSNPTNSNVLKVAKLISDKVLFRFTYADYKALLEKNVVPLSKDGEILCDFRGIQSVRGHSCYVTNDEIIQEVAKNIVEAKEPEPVSQNEEDAEVVDFDNSNETGIGEKEEMSQPKTGNALFKAMINKEAINTNDYPEFEKLLKEFGIVDVDKIIEPQTITISDTKQKIRLFEIPEYLAKSLGNVTLTVSNSSHNSKQEKESLKKRFIKLTDNHYFLLVIAIFFVAILVIYAILNSSTKNIVAFVMIAILLIITYVAFSRLLKSNKRKTKGIKCSIYDIDNLSDGHTFEYVIADLLKGIGFNSVEVTVGSGDYGIDVIANYNSESYAIQCKKYSSKVGISAIQEAHSGKTYYNCNYAVVVTNNYFTPAAENLARSTGVILWDRNTVKKMLRDNGGYLKIEKRMRDKKTKKPGGCFSIIVWLIILFVAFSVIGTNGTNSESSSTTSTSALTNIVMNDNTVINHNK